MPMEESKLDPREVLNAAAQVPLKSIVVIGILENHELVAWVSNLSPAASVFVLEQFKLSLLTGNNTTTPVVAPKMSA